MNEFFAAPRSCLPSEPTALGVHASRLHFARKLVLAAPASGFPSFPIALVSHVPGAGIPCVVAGPTAAPIANVLTTSAIITRFISSSSVFVTFAPGVVQVCVSSSTVSTLARENNRAPAFRIRDQQRWSHSNRRHRRNSQRSSLHCPRTLRGQ